MAEPNHRRPAGSLAEHLQGLLPRALEAGGLGVVMARAGVGKTAFLIQIGLAELASGRDVVHIALGQDLDRVQTRYDALLDRQLSEREPNERMDLRRDAFRRRAIQADPDRRLTTARLTETLEHFRRHLDIHPAVILIDGFDWERAPASVSEELAAFKALAKGLGARLWMSAQTHREQSGPHPEEVPPPVRDSVEALQLAVFLEPAGDRVLARVLWAHGQQLSAGPSLPLMPDSLHAIEDRSAPSATPEHVTLLSGAAAGAEAHFGACAERWGLIERNFTFAGRQTARSRGLVELGPEELRQGDVSFRYLQRRMRRSYPDTEAFRKVLQTIWHQVHLAGEVFAIGAIQQDGTVKGGTGWAVELAKHLCKPVFVFDQLKRAWYTWYEDAWCPTESPHIRHERFCGTGTRKLTDAGRAAIEALFHRSFEPPGQT